jgi:TrmH family RNA methyltransferase
MQTPTPGLSKAQRSSILSLHRKKGREQAAQFLVEGPKGVQEFIEEGWPLERLIVRNDSDWALRPGALVVTPREFAELSTLESPQGVLGVFGKKTILPGSGGWALVLDRVQDPGNVGTLLRLADWFGVDYVAVPSGTAEVWNPKVVQASMGALARMALVHGSPEEVLAQLKGEGRTLYAADLGGQSPQELPLEGPAALVLGNEGQGPDALWTEGSDYILTIPKQSGRKTESLNVATAGAIALYACMSR